MSVVWEPPLNIYFIIFIVFVAIAATVILPFFKFQVKLSRFMRYGQTDGQLSPNNKSLRYETL